MECRENGGQGVFRDGAEGLPVLSIGQQGVSQQGAQLVQGPALLRPLRVGGEVEAREARECARRGGGLPSPRLPQAQEGRPDHEHGSSAAPCRCCGRGR